MSIKHESIIRISVNIFFKGKRHICEIIGRSEPFCKFFTCRMAGANMLVIEAIGKKPHGDFLWSPCSKHELNYFVPFIGKEINKHLNKVMETAK